MSAEGSNFILRCLWTTPAVTAVMTCTPSVVAEEISGAFRIGYDGLVYGHESTTTEVDTINPVSGDTETVESTRSTTYAGLLGTALGINVGFAATDSLVLGLRILQGSATTEWEHVDGESSSTFVQLAPNVEVLLTSGIARPYLMGMLGYRSASDEIDGETVASFGGVVFGAGGGLHVFPASSVSFDPSLTFAWLSGQGEFFGGAERDLTSFAVMLQFGISAWIGGGSSASATSPSDAPEAPASTAPPRKPAEIPPDTESGGKMTTRLPVDDRIELIVSGDPSRSSRELSVTVVLTGPSATNRACKSLAFDVRGERHDLAFLGYAARSGSSTTMEYLRATSQREMLRAVADTDASKLLVCERSWPIGRAPRQRLEWFLVKFQERAVTLGTWQDAEPSPPPSPQEQSPPDGEVTE